MVNMIKSGHWTCPAERQPPAGLGRRNVQVQAWSMGRCHTWWSPNQLCHRVSLHVLRHVQPQHGISTAEVLLTQNLHHEHSRSAADALLKQVAQMITCVRYNSMLGATMLHYQWALLHNISGTLSLQVSW